MAATTEDDSEQPWIDVHSSRRPRKNLKTIIFRPTGINLSKCDTYAIADLITSSAQLTAGEISRTMVELLPAKNLITVRTLRESAAPKLLKLTSLALNDTVVHLRPYECSPENSCRGVIHGVGQNTASEELMRDLVQTTPARILAARMMGATKSALITFEGTSVPRYILYRSGRYRCYPHRPKAQFCTRCHTLGHREDVCPLPHTTRLCPVCSLDITNLSPTMSHDCVPKCRLCKGPHASTFTDCPTRLQANAFLAQQAKQRVQAIQTKHNDPLPEKSSPSGHRSRSRSKTRQRSSSKGRKQLAPPPPPKRQARVQWPKLPPRDQPTTQLTSPPPNVSKSPPPASQQGVPSKPSPPIFDSPAYRAALAAPQSIATSRITVPTKAPEAVADLFPLLVELIQAVNVLGERLQRVEDAQCRKTGKRPAPGCVSSPDLRPPALDPDFTSAGKRPAHLHSPTTNATEDIDISSDDSF